MDFDFWLDLLWDEGFNFLGAVILPTILGVFAGIVLAVMAFVIFRVVGLVNADTPRLARGLVIAWLGLALPFTLGSLGFQLGITKAARQLVTEGRVADLVVPQVGGEIADLVLQLDALMMAQTAGAAPGDSLDAAAFVGRAREQADRIVTQLLPEVAGQMKSGSAMISDGAGEKIFDWFVERFGEEVLRANLNSSLDRHGVVADWFNGLPAAAEEYGSAGMLSRQQLAEYTVESLVRTALASPFDTIARYQKWIGGGMLVLALGLPVVGLLVLRVYPAVICG